jgi:quercetin dioxygenase-like cupin family protein
VAFPLATIYYLYSIPLGADSGTAPMFHSGHEFVFCLGGSVEYEVEDRIYLPNPGDSLLFAAHLSHRWRNAGKTASNLLIILSGFADMDKPMEQHLHKG